MKKPFVILVLAVAASVLLNTARDKKASDQMTRPAEPDLVNRKPLEQSSRQVADHAEETGVELTSIASTNYGADGAVVLRTQEVPVNRLTSRKPTWWEMKAAGEPLRQKFKTEGTHQEIFAQEEEWSGKFKELKKGMTPLQAIAVMGSMPIQAYAAVESEGAMAIVPIPTNAL
ncbi:MAG TPA: hypothetical protein VJW76_14730, partial [Verrucomicrobiae bacterium]|nr:hypothetical protein [Verrucomicrobiae bacterium]